MLRYLHNLVLGKYKGFIPSLCQGILFVFSLAYAAVIRGVMCIFSVNRYRADCKVISVGNITLGGTGKTPLVEYVARYLKKEGHKVAIVTRGYKRLGYRLSVIGYRTPNTENRESNTDVMGDEPYMLKINLKDVPVIVSPDRIRGIKDAVRNYGVDTVILDDGLQQWKIKKNLEIVVIDATNPFGNTHMLPRGILRQPLSSLREVDIFLLSKTNLISSIRGLRDTLAQINPEAEIVESIHQTVEFYEPGKEGESVRVDFFKERTVALCAAIGDPDSFENMVKSLKITPGVFFKFRDHHTYTGKDLCEISKRCAEQRIDTLITTQKDAVKLSELRVTGYGLRVFVLRIELKITKDEERFHTRLLRLYRF